MILEWLLHDQRNIDHAYTAFSYLEGIPLSWDGLTEQFERHDASALVVRVPGRNEEGRKLPDYPIAITPYQAGILEDVANRLSRQVAKGYRVMEEDPLFIDLQGEHIPKLATPYAPVVIPSRRHAAEVERLKEHRLIYIPPHNGQHAHDGEAFDGARIVGAWRTPLRRLLTRKEEYSPIERELALD